MVTNKMLDGYDKSHMTNKHKVEVELAMMQTEAATQRFKDNIRRNNQG
jgi:hypothetical protein